MLRLYDINVTLDSDPGKDDVALHDALKAAVQQKLKGIEVSGPPNGLGLRLSLAVSLSVPHGEIRMARGR